ncbi:MAG: helix-turn-helix domain-containing protein [Prolixibacteraceae bacterium]|nr:helix-turn-helix domain-containing protein [Prolixibacteraceae bacterium]
MNTTINQSLVFTQIILCSFFIIVFTTSKVNRKANNLVAVLLTLFIAFASFDLVKIFAPGIEPYPVYIISSIALLLIFPVFSFYVGALYNISHKNVLIHFILPFVAFLLLLPGLFTNWPAPDYYNNYLIFIPSSRSETVWAYFIANDAFFTLQFFVYALIIVKQIKKIRPVLEENFSSMEGKKLNWILYLLAIVSSIYIFYFVIEVFTNLSVEDYDFIYYIYSVLLLMAFMYGAYRQNEFAYLTETHKKADDDKLLNTNTQFKLSPEMSRIIRQNLDRLAKEEKFYTQRNLTLQELAKNLNTNKNIVSQYINQNLNQNFYGYINSLRVEEAKKLLSQNELEKYSLEGIGYMAGFNSKTTFNTVFKEQTGMSPSEYKKRMSE